MNSEAASLAAERSDEITFELPWTIRIFRSGRIERLLEDDIVPPSLDPATGVESKDVIINPSTGLSARLYLPPSAADDIDAKLPVLIYYHGGGFCVLHASSAAYHNFLNSLTAKAHVLVVSVDYRLAPENPLPAAYEDSWEALRWVIANASASSKEPWLSRFGNSDKIFLGGESAGGNIVHNMGTRIGREGMKVEGLVLLHPYFWGTERIGDEGDESKVSWRRIKDAGGLWPIVCPGTIGLDDPRLNPVGDGAPSLAGIGGRRVLMCVAELDLLRERGRLYYEKLKESGWAGEAEFFETQGEDHAFFLAYPDSVAALALRERLVCFFNEV